MVLAIFKDGNISVGEAFLIAVVAILIVFLTLVIVIVATTLFQKGMGFVEKKMAILPRPENAILSTDEDAVAAVIVASIEFHRSTGKEPRVVSISRIED